MSETYKIINVGFGDTSTSVVQRMSDGACIPIDPANVDYRLYLQWLEEGNTPESAEEQQ